MRIYNTLTRKKEEFKPISPKEVKIYACGPTVYNFIHIGNARPICVFDTLRRYLLYSGYNVNFVQNFTDVDDKIIKKANEEGVNSLEISEKFIKEYQKDAAGLNVMPATAHPKVTENMPEIIAIVQDIITQGYAYEAGGDVYFRASKFKEYGKLSHMPLDELEAGARIDVNDVKEDPMDFALWKKAKPEEPSWVSPWGNGRPGWHIECSAMVRKFLGLTIDIHCGGQDLIFPHHENEIAQSECANGQLFCNYWMHNGYINIDNKKMSKSLNNFFTTREIGEKFGYEPIRLMMLQAHYRSQINYTDEVIASCQVSLQRLYTCKHSMKMSLENAVSNSQDTVAITRLNEFKTNFIKAMDDDLNTADAIAVLFELVREINTNITQNANISKEYVLAAQSIFNELSGVLGLLYNDEDKEKIPTAVSELVEQRNKARKEKNFALADEIREKISGLGYTVEETRQGTKIQLKK
ncbi:MAG: cysteine--tRNA ligase [Oscillospiraceae bacterium]